MIAFLAQYGGTLLLATAVLVVALLVVLIAITRHLERRLQQLEHEIATLHANGAPGPQPTTPEVARRYAAMKAV